MSEIEILAPVGNDDMAIAALNANADAIYVGLDDFGARAYAKNFTLDNIEALIDKMHLFGKKVYITLNTLIKDSEIEKIFFYSKKLYEMGADAFIIQDIGLFKILKKHFKNIEFHASTQMAVNDIYGAKYLKDIGFSRIVIARETPIEEIKKITQIGIETEVFVHGALCVSFSGQCYMSSFLGQRSANRGRCAGPCRKLYELSRENGKKITDTSDYFLSMKDLCTIDRINDLLDAGIKSFKIEGRMKSKEYVFESVKNYKNAINNRNINKEGLVDVSNRGYSSGFIFDQNDNYIDLKENYGHRVVGKIEKNNGINYIKFFSKIYKDSILQIITNKGKKLPYTATKNYEKGEKIDLINFNDAKINSDVLMLNSSKISYDLKENEGLKKRNINFKFKSKIGKFPKLILSYKNYNIVINSKIKTEKSKNFSIDDNYVINSLSKTNSTIYKAKEIEIEIEDGSFIPKKEINSLRRKSIESLNEKIFKSYKRISNAEYKSYPKENKSVIKEVDLELINSEYDLELLKMADNIYFYKFNDILSGFDNLYFVISPFIKYDFKKLINFLIKNEIKGVVINSYRDLFFLNKFKDNNFKIRIGRFLNVFNQESLNFYLDFAEKVCISPELEFKNINNLNGNIEILASGRNELMNMRHCPFSVIKKCGLKGCSKCNFRKGNFILDENKNKYEINRYNTFSVIYNSIEINADLKKLKKDVSLLVLNNSKDSLKKIENFKKRNNFGEINNFNYSRGVI